VNRSGKCVIGGKSTFIGDRAEPTTRKQIYLDEPSKEPDEFVTDGWYIDFDTKISCDPMQQEIKSQRRNGSC
jgi:hypothetical protein